MISIETRTQICEALQGWLKTTLEDAKRLRAETNDLARTLGGSDTQENAMNEEKGERIFAEKFNNGTDELAKGNAQPLTELYAEAVRVTEMLDATQEEGLTPEEIFSFTFLSRKHLDAWRSLLPTAPAKA